MSLREKTAAAYPFDDDLGNLLEGPDATIFGTGGLTTTEAKIGTGSYRQIGGNGAPDRVELGYLDSGNAVWTIAFWIFLDSLLLNDTRLFGSQTSLTPGHIRIGTVASLDIQIWGGSGISWIDIGNLPASPVGAWHHVLIEFALSSKFNFYWDNVFIGQTPQLLTTDFFRTVKGALGAIFGSFGVAADAYFDSPHIFDAHLTAAEKDQLYNNGKGAQYPFIKKSRSRQARPLGTKQGFSRRGSQTARTFSTKEAFN